MAKITSSSTAEYFAKNLQQVGFSSPTKAVLTTLKEAVDNSLDACEEAGIKPEIKVTVRKVGKGSTRSADLISVAVEDNGPGLEEKDLAKVFGEYLASSKFGRGQCSRGQQGIGISAATTWAQLTNAKGVKLVSKTKRMRKAIKGIVNVDIKANKGVLKNRETVDWDRQSGLSVEFAIDGRVQLNGDGGLITYLEGTTLVNPHLDLHYKLMDKEEVKVERVSDDVPKIPAPTLPHPHTMKLGEFITHAHLYGKMALGRFLKSGFSRVTDETIREFQKNGIPKTAFTKGVNTFKEGDLKKFFQAIHGTELKNPSTRSVMTIGEEGLSKSIQRLGEVDFFSVVTRRPRICDHKPTVVEVALARFLDRSGQEENPVQVLRFANRVPLQFDKGACAMTKAIESINWRTYGLAQQRNSVPLGPYIFAVSVVSPFIKFKNASKETVDASDELVEEIRRCLMQAGQKLSRHIRREHREADLERKIAHIESFGPILVECLARVAKAPDARKKRAEEGLKKLLGRDTKEAEDKLEDAKARLAKLKAKQAKNLGIQDKEKSPPAEVDGEEALAEPAQEDLTLEPSDEVAAVDVAKKKDRGTRKQKSRSKVKRTAKTQKKQVKKSTEKATKKVKKKTTRTRKKPRAKK